MAPLSQVALGDTPQAVLHWTPRLVAAHLADAAEMWRREKPAMPDIVVAATPALAAIITDPVQAPGMSAPASPPSPAAIEQMTTAQTWLQWIEPGDRNLVWQRALGRTWKDVATTASVEKTTAWRRWSVALAVIAARLNAAADATALQSNSSRQVAERTVES